MTKTKTNDLNNTLIVLATVVMAIAAIVACRISYIQWAEMNKQSELIKEELYRAYRPWVGISGLPEVKESLTFEKNSAHVLFSFLLKNTGNSIANKVSTSFSLVFGQEILNFSCRSDEVINQFGSVLLPNDEFRNEELVKTPGDLKLPSENTDTIIHLYACVRYTDDFGKGHVTGSSWTYINKEGNSKIKPTGVVEGEFKIIGHSNAD